ncbi:putative multidrug resistance protein fnx1 [Erysiphe neolycopersici]|uniref:Putative multidrug resistance protein fnx1 n=1 Tax=Erysiphe neolycopersici TaxID=212602 RepID=A0A420I1X8_9PEZI|nr:putative multidrug resistance protein fnx1 [Erysiphe neolycopersici]
MSPSSPRISHNSYIKYKISADDKKRLEQAVAWILNPEATDPDTLKKPTPTQACRKYQLDPKRFRKIVDTRIRRANNRTLNERGEYNRHGGNNRLLSDAQEKIISEYITKLAQPGEPEVTIALVKNAIASLLAKESPPREPPSHPWFSGWYNSRKDALGLDRIQATPTAQTRLETPPIIE